MKVIFRRELFTVDTFTSLSLTVHRLVHFRLEINLERPRRKNDLSVHWQFGK